MADRIDLCEPAAEAAAAGVVLTFTCKSEEIEFAGDVSRGDAGLVISRVEARAPMPRGITQQLARKVPIHDVLAEARAHIAQRDTAALAAVKFTVPVTSGRTIVTDDLLKAVALVYLEETAPGKERGSLDRMVARFGRPEGTVRTWLKRARSEGWLGPGFTGRVGAEPGPRLLGMLTRPCCFGQPPAGYTCNTCGATTEAGDA